MKKNFAKLAVVFALSCVSSFAEELHVRVHVPFSFSVAGTSMPAGDYMVSPLTGFNSVLLVEGTSTNAKALVMAQTLDTKSDSSSLVFTMGKEIPTLSVVKGMGRTFEISRSFSPAGSKLATIALPGMATIRKK